MSVAYDITAVAALPEFEPETPRLVPVRVPRTAAARAPRRGLAPVSVLHAPAELRQITLRLTRRGQVLLAVLVALAGAALLWAAASSASREAPTVSGPATVTVMPGDTLWSIASRVAPADDPGAEVAVLQRRNHLTGVELVPGQVLQVR